MFEMKTCPIVNKQNQVFNGNVWDCHEQKCRFQIDGVCVIIGTFVETRELRLVVNRIAQATGVRL